MRRGVQEFFDDQPTDPKVPTWDGTGESLGLEVYRRMAMAYEAGLDEDKLAVAAPKLWLNLRGSAREACEMLGMADLRVKTAGTTLLLDTLAARFPEGASSTVPCAVQGNQLPHRQ